ncbi:hypothetical protein [uncultured Winogradskyella sp.]|uniref:hypothetical protein n=1 Tax=uncultured Winogradskyella sp. TaxID=395353 RepID=UPI0030EE09ED|tara:strand:+ start:191 stop:973 length:783 start_codon:yes stop_codon:yes gene_type:complete
MKKSIILSLLFISIQYCFSQNKQSKNGIKRILLTEMTRELYSDGNYYTSLTETNETFYDKKGKKLKTVRITYEKSKPKSKNTTTYHYNSNKKVDYSISFLDEDSVSFKTYYSYRDNLLVKRYFNYIKNQKESKFEEVYNYNKNHKLISSNYVYYEKYIDSNLDDYITFFKLNEKYDKKERTIEMDYSESDSIYKHNRFIYKWKRNGVLSFNKEYDVNNKLISKTHFNYLFNDRNHWTVKKAFKNKSLHKTSYREIEYYQL